jgi:hypothetical protein
MSRGSWYAGLLLALAAPFLLWGGVAAAHEARSTVMLLDMSDARVAVEAQLPVDQLVLGITRSFEESPLPYVQAHPDTVRRYVEQNLSARAPDGRPFALTLEEVGVERVDDGDCYVVHARLEPPTGALARSFTLRSTIILGQVMNHQALVAVRHDFRNGLVGESPELLGVLDYQRLELPVERATGAWWQGFTSVVRLGARHISEGTDHLLFLLVLLLPAPLLARTRGWREADTLRGSFRRIVRIVTAFTLGHSLTLAAAALGVLRLPSRPVEVLIALSILVSAAHAVRPLFPGREALVAASFGLVHGLAFATVLAGAGVDGTALAGSLLGFNVGIELMQCAVVLAVLPVLLAWSRTPLYAPLRLLGAAFAALAACGWLVERAMARPNPMARIIEVAAEHSVGGLAVLAVGAALALLVQRLRVSRSPGPQALDGHPIPKS